MALFNFLGTFILPENLTFLIVVILQIFIIVMIILLKTRKVKTTKPLVETPISVAPPILRVSEDIYQGNRQTYLYNQNRKEEYRKKYLDKFN